MVSLVLSPVVILVVVTLLESIMVKLSCRFVPVVVMVQVLTKVVMVLLPVVVVLLVLIVVLVLVTSHELPMQVVPDL